MALIKVKNVTLAYDGYVVESGLNFMINSGDYLCIVGENGSGKSTLMKALLGLLKVQSGEIKYCDGLLPKEVGYLPQMNSIQKDFPASCMEVVLSGTLNQRGIKPFYSKDNKRVAKMNMEYLSILDLAKTSFQNLSGGQQQRVLLARALSATKKLLILDEPVTGLDPVVTASLYKLIEKLNKEKGITIVMVSHDIAGSVENASHILHINGKKTFFGTKQEYLKSSASNAFAGGKRNDI